jgi:hypothetical protein
MSLPWVRIDADIGSHDKILALLTDPNARPVVRFQSAWSYVCAIGWSAKAGTDGAVPSTALPWIHGTPATGRLLVTHGLWEPNGHGGWAIHNYADRQPLARVVEIEREAKREGGRRSACRRWHGPECWGPDGCSRAGS